MPNIALYILITAIWSTTWIAIKFQLGVVDPLVSTFYRFLIAGLFMAAYLAVKGRLNRAKFSRRDHIFIAMQGVLMFSLSHYIVYNGSIYLASGLVAVASSTVSIMNAVNQAIFFKIKLRMQVLIGNLLGLAGIFIIFGPEFAKEGLSDAVITGLLLCTLASYVASGGQMFALRNTSKELPIFEVNTVGMFYGALCSLILILVTQTQMTYDSSISYTLSLLYLAIFGSAIAFVTYVILIKNIGADKAAYVTILLPIIALCVSTVFEGYQWSLAAVIGLALAISGNVVTMINRENLSHWRKKMVDIKFKP